MRRWTALASALGVVAASALAATPAAAAVRHYWVAAVPVTWNAVPNGRDAIGGTRFDPAQTIFPTTVFRRYDRGWRHPLRNVGARDGNMDRIPGPLLRARVGDRLHVHFRNMEPRGGPSHSMHFHGVRYRPSSDGAFVPGFSGRDGDVRPGQRYTYRLRAGARSAGVWPYHDHSPSMDASIAGGMYGMLSILGPRERRPDREFQVVFAPVGQFQGIDGRAFVGNTPVFRARPGELVQWDVMAMGSEHHTFHVHGHRWRAPDGTPLDTATLGPAQTLRMRWREDDPGTWLYHCHVESHMAQGMIGIYQVRRR